MSETPKKKRRLVRADSIKAGDVIAWPKRDVPITNVHIHRPGSRTLEYDEQPDGSRGIRILDRERVPVYR